MSFLCLLLQRIMEEQEINILNHSTDMYLRYGIRSVTMDDVARDMGISKKTLYKYFSNKAELVDKGVRLLMSKIVESNQCLFKSTNNAIDDLVDIMRSIETRVKSTHPAIQYQLKKYYPSTYEFMESKKKEMILDMTRANLLKGIEQGLYRKEINIDIIAYLYYGRVLVMTEQGMMPTENFEHGQIAREHMVYHVRGIATPQGIEHLEKSLNTYSKQ